MAHLEPCPTCTELCRYCPRLAPPGGWHRALGVPMAEDIEAAMESSPSLGQKVANFATAVTEHVVAGFRTLPREDTEVRLAVCRSCPQFQGRTCKLCGCNMHIKASWAEQDCPLGKWPKLERESDELAIGSSGPSLEQEQIEASTSKP